MLQNNNTNLFTCLIDLFSLLQMYNLWCSLSVKLNKLKYSVSINNNQRSTKHESNNNDKERMNGVEKYSAVKKSNKFVAVFLEV